MLLAPSILVRCAALLLAASYLLVASYSLLPRVEYIETGLSCCTLSEMEAQSCCCCQADAAPLPDAACLINAPCTPGAPDAIISVASGTEHLAADAVGIQSPTGRSTALDSSVSAPYPPLVFPLDKIPRVAA